MMLLKWIYAMIACITMTKKSKWHIVRILFVAGLLMIVFVFSLAGLVTFGYEDNRDWMIALMFLGVPGLVLMGDIIMFIRFDKFYTKVRFVLFNFLVSFGAVFIIEAVLVLAVFGIKQPQYKLFGLAAGFALITAVLSILYSAIFAIVADRKRNQ